MPPVRAVVGTPLQEAQAAAENRNYKAAMAKMNEAEAVPNKTAEESTIITQMKELYRRQVGRYHLGGAAAAKAKFANDYDAKNYKDVIADGEALKKVGALDGATMQVVAQAYYLSGDKAGCVKYIKGTWRQCRRDHAGAADALRL